MVELLSIILALLAALLLIPSLVLTVECLMAIGRPTAADRGGGSAGGKVGKIVVIPAHDEELAIGATLSAVFPELAEGDRVIVVADNCTDATAEVAERLGATVLRRTDSQRRGKGYALDFALQHIAKEPCDVVIFLDADCTLSPGSLALLADVAHREELPVQAYYEMKRNSQDRTPGQEIAEFAWLLRGRVRPLGLAAMNMPCQLYGSGMAFPWSVLQSVSLASGNIVEDMKLTLDLIERGRMPIYCANAKVASQFPTQSGAINAQRKRWEHGHLSSIFKYGIPAAWHGLLRMDMRRMALALDICVPPLFLLVIVQSAFLLATVALHFLVGAGEGAPLVAAAAWFMTVMSVVLVWSAFGRDIVTGGSLRSLPSYALSKISVYLKFFTDRQKEWNRTDRQ